MSNNKPNIFTVNLEDGSYVDYLPLHKRSLNQFGQPELARVQVGEGYVGIGVLYTPPINTPDVLRGGWYPVQVQRKRAATENGGSSKPQTLFVPMHTVYGDKRPPQHKQVILVNGVQGSVAAPTSSEVVEVFRDGNSVLLTVNEGCKFYCKPTNGRFTGVCIDPEFGLQFFEAEEPVVQAVPQPAEPAVKQLAPAQPVQQPVIADLELWKQLSYPEGWDSDESPDKEWLDLLFVTLKAMANRWIPRIQHVYPELPYKGVCRPLAAATYQSTQYSTQWNIDSQYFAGFYEGSLVGSELDISFMPPNRLLMRCLYEAHWLARAPKSQHPEPCSVLLTLPAFLDSY